MSDESVQFEVGILPQWQPIESAPKSDLHVIIAGRYANGRSYVEESYWDPRGHWSARKLEPPTHWMPLLADYEDHLQQQTAPDCPCGGWDCTGAPEGPMYGCPYHQTLRDGQLCPSCGCRGNGEA